MSLQIELRDCADSVTIARTGLLREAADALDALTAENAALKADAERYRWLRQRHNGDQSAWHVRTDELEIPVDLDAAIDKAKQ